MRIAMIGSGYVGLVSGACLSEFGHSVVCVDKDESKIAALKKGSIPIFEPGLDDVVATNARAGRLAFTSDLAAAIRDLAEPHTQTDPELKSDRRYTNLSAREVRARLRTEKGYAVADLPSERTISPTARDWSSGWCTTPRTTASTTRSSGAGRRWRRSGTGRC